MQPFLLLVACAYLLCENRSFSQTLCQLNDLKPPKHFENVHVLKIAEDSLQSSFLIWVKSNVKGHFHQNHTENIIVLEGKALMRLGNDTLTIKTGDYLNVPKTTPHAVLEVLSKKPLKVLSIQAPTFDGTDRVFMEE